ncbi:hypothetical protein GCM10027046_17290 [Uliginosibacterium flavum]
MEKARAEVPGFAPVFCAVPASADENFALLQRHGWRAKADAPLQWALLQMAIPRGLTGGSIFWISADPVRCGIDDFAGRASKALA